LKDPSKSDDKLGELLKQIASLPCPEKTGGLETGKNGMRGLPSADTALNLAAQGLPWVLKLEIKSDCAARMESNLELLEEEGPEGPLPCPLPCPDDCGSCALDEEITSLLTKLSAMADSCPWECDFTAEFDDRRGFSHDKMV
jgi:hypothetical protein